MIPLAYKKLLTELERELPASNLITDDLHTFAYGTDASFYRLIPKIVIKVESEKELVFTIKMCAKHKIPFTFRAAGTSLSGQAISDSVLIKLAGNWSAISIQNNGQTVKMQPGIIGGRVNNQLAGYNRKLGPDPASINSAKIGGIIANNASGMTSGTDYNSYNTLVGMKIILADGTILDTLDAKSRESFIKSKPELLNQIKELTNKVKSRTDLSKKINDKYKIKNTCGYGLNSLTDFSDPFDVITHLMVGSEGTLAFISEVTLDTVPDLPYKATAFLLFKDVPTACSILAFLESSNVDSAELMDIAALKVVKDLADFPLQISSLTADSAALLIEVSAHDEANLETKTRQLTDKFKSLTGLQFESFTTDPKKRNTLWNIRKGLFPTGCKNRAPGTTVIIEDLNFPVTQLSEAIQDLQKLLSHYSYSDSFIWGHALSGNIHFVLTQKFDSEDRINNYNNFMQEIVRLVIDKYNGSLKAEHGTGRNMAPFVKYEWGDEAYEIMKEIKEIFDPQNIMNPGVIINQDQNIHLKNIKSLPIIHEKIDKCTECGFCESVCPSKDLTLSPRQRISLLRKSFENTPYISGNLKKLSKEFNYNFETTCAVDGLCELSCPVNINVGQLVKEYRSIVQSGNSNFLASFIAGNFKLAVNSARFFLRSVYLFRKLFGDKIISLASNLFSKISSGIIPNWHPSLPNAGTKITAISTSKGKPVVYFPSCTNRIFSGYPNQANNKSLNKIIESVLSSAGYSVNYPANVNNLCCGMAFESKGFFKQGLFKSEELYTTLSKVMSSGNHPVLFDTSPCAFHFKNFIKNTHKEKLEIYDPVDFIYEKLKDTIPLKKLDRTIASHAVCSLKKQGDANRLKEISALCAKKVITTDGIGCCGFAGDRGFNYPELSKSALNDLPISITKECTAGYSTSRTCEIGLTKESGVNFNSIFTLLEESILEAKR